MVDSADFSKRLQKIMERNELNASSFAERIRVGRSSISHILSGRNKPSLDFVINTVTEFPEVDLYWLLNGTGTYPKIEIPPASSTGDQHPASISLHNKADPNRPEPSIEKSKDLFSTSKNEKPALRVKSKEGKNIQKVILFYDDGSFEYFIP
jgi:transcriptional regulator with XRE-family HTH domain